MRALHFLWSFSLLLAFAAPAFASDVASFGAKGDGKADDTEAVQKAVNAGGAIRFASGATYRLTRTITINLDQTGFVALRGDGTSRIVMAGAGPAFQFIGTHAGSADPQQFKPNVWERQRMPRVDELEIVGAHPEADGIAATGTMQITITRVIIREARHAIRMHGRNRNVLISDCHLYHNRGIGIFYDQVNLHQTNINGSHISYNAGGGIVVRGGDVRNVHIGNCDIESNMAADTPATANVLIDSTAGSVGEVAITGCTIQHNPNGPNSANIRIIGSGVASATNKTPTNEGHVTITGNVLSDVQVNVHLQAVRGVTLTGNTFWMGFAHDLLVEDSSNVVVGPNNLDRNPRYEGTRTSARGGVVFRRSRDCTITGLHVNGVRHHAAAVLLEQCARFSFSNASILDCDGVGLQLQDSSLTRVTGSIIRDDRETSNSAPALVVAGGGNNHISGNSIDRAAKIDATSGVNRDNETVPRKKR
jgi:hypothetical protein